MKPICSINRAIKHFKGDLEHIYEFCNMYGIVISRKALKLVSSLSKN